MGSVNNGNHFILIRFFWQERVSNLGSQKTSGIVIDCVTYMNILRVINCINAHQASADVSATGTILRAELFWKERLWHLFILLTDESSTISTTTNAPPDDSDTDLEDRSEDSDEEEEQPPTIGWKPLHCFFGYNAKEKLQEYVGRRQTRAAKVVSRLEHHRPTML